MLNPTAPKTVEIPPARAVAELETILASKNFATSHRLSRFLRYVVEQTLAGNAGALKEYQVALDVFGRSEDFDPREDAIVRVEARQLRFKLADYYAGPGQKDDIVISLPKGGYAAEFQQRTAGPGPVDNITVDTTPPQMVGAGRRWGMTWALLGAVAAVVAGTWSYVGGRTHAERSPSIAVLPLTNLSANPSNQYFADGLTDEITDALSRVKTLRVVARSSAAAFKGKSADIGEVGRRLNVANVLEGSVERSGDQVKVSVHLDRVSDGSRVWSNIYLRSSQDLFAVQSELAAGIAGSLKAAAGTPRPITHVPNSEAHDCYMKGRYAADQLTAESLTKAAEFYRRAIELDPNYAAAYAGLGSVTANFAAARSSVRTKAEQTAARQYWRKATELDPDLPSPHSNLALFAMTYDWDWAGAERELQTSLARQPNAGVESTYGLLCTYRRRFLDADEHFRRSEDLDPLGTTTLINLAWGRYLEGRFSDAREEYQKVATRFPGMLLPRLQIEALHMMTGRPDLALLGFQKLEHRYPLTPLMEAQAKATAGQREEALRLILPFEESAIAGKQEARFSKESLAAVYATLGDEANTLKWLEQAADERDNSVVSIAVNPVYARLQNTAGFQALKKRIGLE